MSVLFNSEFWARLLGIIYVAGEMMTDDPMVRRWLGGLVDAIDDPLSVGLAVAMAALGWWLARTGGGRLGAETGG